MCTFSEKATLVKMCLPRSEELSNLIGKNLLPRFNGAVQTKLAASVNEDKDTFLHDMDHM